MNYIDPQLLFHGRRIDVLSVEAQHPNGDAYRQEVVAHPGAVVILPLLDPHTVIMIRNHRPVVQQTLWELPAGTLEKEEDPASCARRELQEETGYYAEEITPLFHFFSTPGFCNEMLHIFLAQKLLYKGQNLDVTEHIQVETLPLTQTLQMIREGIIHDAKTICSLLYYHTFSRAIPTRSPRH